MTPGDYPLKLYRGDSYKWRFVVWADKDKTQPSDLTGAEAAAQIRDKPGGTLLMTLTCVIELPNVINVSLAAGMWPVSVTKNASWDLELTYPDGEVDTIIAGKVTITIDVTNTTQEVVQLQAVS